MNFDAKSITLNEMIDVETVLGHPFDPDKMSKWEASRVLAWVLMRRDDPTVTLADAGRLSIADLEALGFGEGESSGEAPGAGNGLSPPVSPAPGTLTRSP